MTPLQARKQLTCAANVALEKAGQSLQQAFHALTFYEDDSTIDHFVETALANVEDAYRYQLIAAQI